MKVLLFSSIYIFFSPLVLCFGEETKFRPRKGNGPSGGDGRDPSKIFEELKKNCETLENDKLIPCLMSSFLQVYEPIHVEFCHHSDEDCMKSVQAYADRCAADESKCHQFDNIELIKLEAGKIMAPDLVEAEVANLVFNKSGAYKFWECPSCLCLGDCNCDCDFKYVECEYKRNYMAFIQTVTNKYMETTVPAEEEENDIQRLQRFVYYSCLYYNNFYVYQDDGDNCCTNRNLQAALRYSRSYSTRKRFGKMRRRYKMEVFVAYKDITRLFDCLVVFLTNNPVRKHRKVALSFAKVFRYTLIKSVPTYKHSYLFAFYLQKNTIDVQKYSDPHSPDGHDLVKEFLKRCKDGECYRFDDYKLFDDEESQDNYLVPQLSEVNLVYHLLKNCNFKYGKVNSLLTNNTRPAAEVKFMAPRLLKVNQYKFDGTNSHRFVLQSFLYYAAIKFVESSREWSLTRFLKGLIRRSEKEALKEYLASVASHNYFIITRTEMVRIVTAFEKYLTNSYFRNKPERVKQYVETFKEVLGFYCSVQEAETFV